MNLKRYSLLTIMKPRLSEKKYRELCREIEWREEQKYLNELKKKQEVQDETIQEEITL